MKRRDQLSRRQFLQRSAITGGALLASGRPGVIWAQKPVVTVSTQLNWIKTVDFAGFYIADSKGYYAQESIKAQLLPGGPNLQGVESIVAGGAADVGIATLLTSVIDGVTRGSDFVVFATVFQTSPLVLVSKPDKPVRSAKDLLGKRIGGPQGRQREIEAVFKINNLPANYTFVPVGYGPQPLTQGDVDVLSAYTTDVPLVLAKQGLQTIQVSYKDLGLPTYSNALFASRKYIDKQRDALIGYLRGTIKGWEMNAKDPTLGAHLAVEQYGTDLGLQLDDEVKKNEVQIPLTQSDLTKAKGLLWIDRDYISGPIYDGLRAAGRTMLPPVEKFVDTSLLAEAYGGKTSLLS
jgi:ABC-type nitrate/sulfonate/bicarbonate transport system substrate-binding protein